MRVTEQLSHLSQYMVLFVGSLLIFFLLSRYLYINTKNERFKNLLFNCWESYLDSLSMSLTRLKALRAVLSQTRNISGKEAICKASDAIYQNIHQEIAACDLQLETMSKAQDDEWYATAIVWRPVPDLKDEIAHLLEIAKTGISDEELEKYKIEWEKQFAQKSAAEFKKLEEEIRRLNVRIEELEAELENAQTANARSSTNPEALAAELMQGLEDNLDLTRIEGKLATAKGEVVTLENKISESNDDSDIEKMQGQIAWLIQVQRWWTTQKMYRQKATLLDQATLKGFNSTDEDDSQEAMERMQEFQDVEARNAEMRKNLKEMTAFNKKLNDQLDTFESDKANAEELRLQLAKIDQARRSAEREMKNIEPMMAESEKEISELRIRNSNLSNKSREQTEKTSELQNELADIKKKTDEKQDELTMKLIDTSLALEKLKESFSKGNIEGMVPEEEVMSLQTSYDQLNSEMMQARAAIQQAERQSMESKTALDQVETDHEVLLQNYLNIKKELKDTSKEKQTLDEATSVLEKENEALKKEKSEMEIAYARLEIEKASLEDKAQAEPS